MKFEMTARYLEDGEIFSAFWRFFLVQLAFAMVAGVCVYIEPISGGSGIPEVKCYLNGIDLPNVLKLRTLFCKVIGVTCSVSAGLPVGKEGPMIHSGAVVANAVASGAVKNDRQLRDLVTCGAAAGVCTAFSAPIGGILFALEEGASYWSPSVTWRTFTCSMVALTALLTFNSIGVKFGRVGFDKLFSFGNFKFEEGFSSFAIYELAIFIMIGAAGGLVGAIFNNINETITHWRMKRVNVSKGRRFLEVMVISSIMSCVMFSSSLAWPTCTPITHVFEEGATEEKEKLWDKLIQFRCEEGEYNEMASLIFSEPGDAIRLLFHLHKHAFSTYCLVTFFLLYISIAVVTYGIAVPSGLFVPSLLSGAAFGRLFGNQLAKLHPRLAFSNTYSLIGAAAVLGGMARMTISLTVILLECTGNEQFVLPLMLVLMTARIVGSVYNDDLYHIHIHLKKGVEFLEAELKSINRHHNLVAGQIMGRNVIFIRPVEKVGIIYDILVTSKHSNFPVVDTDDRNILDGTIGRNALCVLLQQKAFGYPTNDSNIGPGSQRAISSNYLQVGDQKYYPLVQWEVLFKSHPRYPRAEDLLITEEDRDQYVDLRPYINNAAITVQETSSVEVCIRPQKSSVASGFFCFIASKSSVRAHRFVVVG
jgi:chloride channel 7